MVTHTKERTQIEKFGNSALRRTFEPKREEVPGTRKKCLTRNFITY
jgi:hypothetical protein